MQIRTAIKIEQIYNEVYGCGGYYAHEELVSRLKAAGIMEVESKSAPLALVDEARAILDAGVSASPAPTTIPAGLPAIRKALQDICKAFDAAPVAVLTIDLTNAIDAGRLVLDQHPEMTCAWCHPNDHRPGITHGICAKHAQEVGEWLDLERRGLVI